MPFTEFTVRSGGSNLYAGSLDGSAEASTTPLVTYTNGGWNSGTGVFTVASGDPVADGVAVGHFASVYVDGASAPTTRIGRITARTTTTITVSTGAGSGTAPTTAGSGITLVVGGAWSGPSGTSAFPIGFLTSAATNSSSNLPRINFKNDQTYSVTAAIAANQQNITYQGYASAFEDGGRATIDGGTTGASYVLVTASQAFTAWADLIFQNNGATGSATLFNSSTRTNVFRCLFRNGCGFGLDISQSVAMDCEVTGCNINNTAALAGARSFASDFVRCNFHDNAGTNTSGAIVTASSSGTFVNCLFDTNGASGFTSLSAIAASFVNCVFYNNVSHGLNHAQTGTDIQVSNSIFDSNGGYGLVATGGSVFDINNAYRNNTSGATNVANNNTSYIQSGAITLTVNPFTDAANGDFSLNATAGGGAACRAAADGTVPFAQGYTSSTTAYLDVGIAQHQDSGGGGSVAFSTTGRMIG